MADTKKRSKVWLHLRILLQPLPTDSTWPSSMLIKYQLRRRFVLRMCRGARRLIYISFGLFLGLRVLKLNHNGTINVRNRPDDDVSLGSFAPYTQQSQQMSLYIAAHLLCHCVEMVFTSLTASFSTRDGKSSTKIARRHTASLGYMLLMTMWGSAKRFWTWGCCFTVTFPVRELFSSYIYL